MVVIPAIPPTREQTIGMSVDELGRSLAVDAAAGVELGLEV